MKKFKLLAFIFSLLNISFSIGQEYEESVFQGHEETDLNSINKYVNKDGDIMLDNYIVISNRYLEIHSPLNYAKFYFTKGNNLCGIQHNLDLNCLALKNAGIDLSSYVRVSNEDVFRISSRYSVGDGRVTDYPSKTDIGSILYLGILRNFILYRKKQNLSSCPICLPPSEDEIKLFSEQGLMSR